MALDVFQFSALSDNYGFLIRCSQTGACAVIDTPDSAKILAEAKAVGWDIHEIWNTHHHWDHAGGNDAIRTATGPEPKSSRQLRKLKPLAISITP